MSPTDITVTICLGLAALLCAIYWVARFKPRHAKKETLGEIERMFSGAEALALSSDAYFWGLDKNWSLGWKGRGVLVLTQQVLYFRRWSKTVDLTIPTDRIEAVSAHGEGAGPKKAQLLVSYRGLDNQLRVASWSVERPKHWTELMQEIQKRRCAADGEAQKKRIPQDEDASGSSRALGGEDAFKSMRR